MESSIQDSMNASDSESIEWQNIKYSIANQHLAKEGSYTRDKATENSDINNKDLMSRWL